MNARKAQQQVFDTVWNGINAQGGPSVDSPRVCMYRGKNGRKCAIGFLIPDNQYNLDLEKYSVSQLRQRLAHIPIFNQVARIFLEDLRIAHDSAERNARNEEKFMALWRFKMRMLAEQYDLKVPEEENE